MTCDHVLGLIDAGPFADYPPTHLEAAWAHAHQCATCGLALRLATALAQGLSAMPNPEPPAHLAPAILARIARRQTGSASRGVPTPAAPRTWQDHAAAAAGVIAAALIAALIASGEGPPVDLTSSRVGGTGLLAMERTGTWWMTLAVSLALYLVGLFVPVRARGHLPTRLKP